ncbi:MAG: helix-turn-helix domain-containing protein, partial [Dehalococcoidia bacterium]
LLTDLIPGLERACRTTTGKTRQRACAILTRTYHATAAALSKLGETDAAWVAADRAISAAERSGDRLLMAEGAFRLTLVFQADRRYEQAEHTATTAIDALQPLAAAGESAAIALQGALLLQLAIAAARQNRVEQAHTALAGARRAADTLGADRNDYNTEFGPTNVAVHEIAVAVELGNAGTALRLAAGTNTESLSPERRARVLIDIARAHMQRRNGEGAIHSLLDAARITPEQVRGHRLVQSMIHDLCRAGLGRDPRLRDLAERCGIHLR